jgi:hypothetical protein
MNNGAASINMRIWCATAFLIDCRSIIRSRQSGTTDARKVKLPKAMMLVAECHPGPSMIRFINQHHLSTHQAGKFRNRHRKCHPAKGLIS